MQSAELRTFYILNIILFALEAYILFLSRSLEWYSGLKTPIMFIIVGALPIITILGSLFVLLGIFKFRKQLSLPLLFISICLVAAGIVLSLDSLDIFV